jgi:hypothetical protein
VDVDGTCAGWTWWNEEESTNDDCDGNTPPPLAFTFQYAKTWYGWTTNWSGNDVYMTEWQDIGTHLKYWSGGTPGIAATNFIKLTASAFDVIGHQWIAPASLILPPGPCDSNGSVYFRDADHQYGEATVTAPGFSNYTFDVTMDKAKLALTRGGADITGQTNTVIVGEQIALTCKFLNMAGADSSIAPITNFQWSIPGTYISNYVTTVSTGTVYYLTNVSDFKNASITYYWVQGSGGSPLEVQCTAIAKGVTMTAKAKFNVIRPSVDWNSTFTAQVAVDTNWSYPGKSLVTPLHLGNPSGMSGITFVATNFDLSTYVGGGWEFLAVQIGSSTVVYSQTNGTNIVGQGAGLDSELPYDTFPLGLPGVTSDNPTEELASVNRTVARSDAFSMFLLFQPWGGIAVPLRRIDWSWSGTATNALGVWSLVLGSGTETISANNVDTTSFPIWTNNIATPVYFMAP